MHADEGTRTSAVDHAGTSPDGTVTVHIRGDPVMQTAGELVARFSRGKTLVLKASGDAIPGAVAVANILIESILRGDAVIRDITVDSEAPPGIGMMVSTIEIVMVRSGKGGQ